MAEDTKFFDIFKRNILLQLHTLGPAKVLNLDSQNKYARIQPLLLSADDEGSLYRHTPIDNALVTRHCRNDIKVGNTVFFVCCERSLDNFIPGEFIDPDDVRTHDLKDAVILGVWEE